MTDKPVVSAVKTTKKTHSHAQVSKLTDFVLTGSFFTVVAYTIYVFLTKPGDGYDLAWFLLFCVGVVAAIKLTDTISRVVFRNMISERVLSTGAVPHPLAPDKTFAKFVATVWQFVIHASATVLEAYILWDESWLSHPYTCFEPINYTPKQILRLFYILQLAVWICTCFSHRFNSDAHAHKDYIMMYVHHLATIGLVSISYAHGQTRSGLVVLFLHDASDIGVDLLKMSNYLSIDGLRNFFVVEFVYAITMVLWVFFRLWYFPVYIIWHAAIWSFGLIGNSVNGHVPPLLYLVGEEYDTYWWVDVICAPLLIILFCMHIWWFILLARILVRMVTEEDIRKIGNDEYEGDHGDMQPVADKTKESSQSSAPNVKSKSKSD